MNEFINSCSIITYTFHIQAALRLLKYIKQFTTTCTLYKIAQSLPRLTNASLRYVLAAVGSGQKRGRCSERPRRDPNSRPSPLSCGIRSTLKSPSHESHIINDFYVIVPDFNFRRQTTSLSYKERRGYITVC